MPPKLAIGAIIADRRSASTRFETPDLASVRAFFGSAYSLRPTSMVRMNRRGRSSWLVYALAVLSAGAIVAAVLVVGPASAGSSTVTRTATAATGLVQSTVSGSGNLAPASQLDLGFKTSGTVTHIYVRQGQQVAKGQLLATLDPQSAEVTLQQARAGLQSAEANLASEEETGGEGSSGQAKGSGEATAKAAAAAPAGGVTPTTTIGATTPTTTTPSNSTSERGASKQSSGSSTAGSGSSTPAATSTISEATRDANLASAKAAVRSDRLTVQSDEQAVADTRLYAPEDGTIASLSGEVGEVVSGGGTTRASSGESSSASTGATSASSAAKGAAASSSSTGASSSPFAVLSDLSSMRLVVPLSESEVGSVRAGQIATVTVEALEGKKLAAHVREVAILSTSNSGVVSYDVTFQIEQMLEGLKPGMSATAEVVIKQASGINVPTSAISGGSVTVLHGSRRETRQVTTGLAGDSATLVTSGLKAGETVLLPTATTSSSSSRGALSGLRGGFRGLGGAGGAGGGLGAGGGPPGGGAALRGGG
jgi:multidrug efflux pump subunit AcrA (membrane-fusion protein)